jgi:hypothetical protein
VTGTIANSTNSNAVTVTSSNGGTGNTAIATIVVLAPPSITKQFGVASLRLHRRTSLTFTITNPNTSTSLTGVAFTDTLPTGLLIAPPHR